MAKNLITQFTITNKNAGVQEFCYSSIYVIDIIVEKPTRTNHHELYDESEIEWMYNQKNTQTNE